MLWAARKGKEDVLALCLKYIPKPRDVLLELALAGAASEGHLHVVKWLLSRYPSLSLVFAIRSACERGNLEILRFLFQSQPPEYLDYLLGWTSRQGHAAVVEELLGFAESLDKKVFIDQIMKEARDDKIRGLLSSKREKVSRCQDDADFMLACKQGQQEEVERLCQSGISPNIEDAAGQCPLSISVERGDVEMVKLLLSHGASVKVMYNDKTLVLLALDALMIRHIWENCENWRIIIEILVQWGAPTTGALYGAVFINDLRVLQILIRNGVQIDEIYRSGETALHLAARMGHEAAMVSLLNAGANVRIFDDYGRTPMHSAIEKWMGYSRQNF